ncbi:penicillin-binding protein 1A [Ottowia sp.]|uniref:penicillin-binding protein 1A n=1 Tax=Ottowia sp. TaxID=1898956 RepID=UPI002C38D847|nr:penicillin-binding protein 1A [Ottowia sp.]HRN74552.1 penicillin-binding protein 1A [Ottowia sp.]HRQ01992.1 penicillin-binding protein 1A [Ottowia sp.]
MATERSQSPKRQVPAKSSGGWLSWLTKLVGWTAGLALAAVLCVGMAGLMALAIAYPNLPDVSQLSNYRPKLPLRVYTSEGTLMAEFGDERRNLTPINQVPKVMKDAVLAIEDARFYEHGGVDYVGVARAALANLGREKAQGASTITMQVARNVYLSSEKTYTRKIYEVLLTFKLEHLLSKDQILEIYMNQIFLGNRAYGFAAAADTYFGKPLQDLTVAEAAMLAGIPKFPSTANPIANFARARERQLHIIDRMLENNFITAEQAAEAKQQELQIRPPRDGKRVHAEYVAETVRQMVFAQYGEETYSRGLNVYTSINSEDQDAAYEALRRGILDYERRQAYRGPEKFVELPKDPKLLEEAVDDALADRPNVGDMLPAIVLEASARRVTAMRQGGERIEINGNDLRATQSGLSAKAAPGIRIRPGAVIRVVQNARGNWETTQLPEVEGALVALDPRNGAVKALVGGFDFDKNKFNHVTQAWRQPGSSFKPFIYSAALEKGFSPTTMINDTPLFFDSSVTGGQPWEPKNYEGGFEGPMTMKRGLARSRNMISIRVLQTITPQFGQEWVTRFGFDTDKHPPYLTMALGAGSVTPMQLASGFAVFANGGYRVNPFLITRITDHTGRILVESQPSVPTEANRAIDARNAFIMNAMLQDVTRSGTASRAQATLKRSDIAGKTGTTNDSMDAWFAGYQPSLVAVVWMGYDTPRNLGARETGGGLSLPIWINFMQSALKGVPVAEAKPPEGVVKVGGDWYYEEYARGGGISNLGGAGLAPREPEPAMPEAGNVPAPSEERNRILDLFKN